MILFRCKANKSQPNSLIGWEIVGSQYNNGVYDHVVSNSIISVLTFLNRNASKLKVLFSFLRRQVGDLQRFYYLIWIIFIIFFWFQIVGKSFVDA